ncbi:MAG: hypothetical protein P9L99_20340 [Candidatus Lernaella stagnicola]|nr:hypothetical protein [Candidatus Lernaella stagnicola]
MKNEQEIIAKLKEKSVDGNIVCAVALALADELGVSPRVIGDLATRGKIRIRACQLGCFK